MSTVIVDYGSGNLRSAEKALQRAAHESGLDAGAVTVSADAEAVRRADRIVLPGVGAFRDCHAGLAAVPGMMEAIREGVAAGKPFFGVCVGMQLMASIGREHGETPGFSWIPGAVERITPADPALKIPHMGWNTLTLTQAHPVFTGVADGEHAYFVHSYHLTPEDPAHVLARAEYGGPIIAAVGRDTMVGTQFHPEKSQAVGLRILANFLSWAP